MPLWDPFCSAEGLSVHRGDEMAGLLDKQMSSLLGLMKRLPCFCLFLLHNRNKESSCRALKCQLSITHVNPSAKHGKKNLIWSSVPAWIISVIIVSRQLKAGGSWDFDKNIELLSCAPSGGQKISEKNTSLFQHFRNRTKKKTFKS